MSRTKTNPEQQPPEPAEPKVKQVPVLVGDRFLTIKEVSEYTTLSPAVIYERMAAGDFPHSYELGGRRVGWSLVEIFEWIEQIKSQRGRAVAAAA